MDEWERFYRKVNMEDIPDTDCMHVKRVCKDFKKFR